MAGDVDAHFFATATAFGSAADSRMPSVPADRRSAGCRARHRSPRRGLRPWGSDRCCRCTRTKVGEDVPSRTPTRRMRSEAATARVERPQASSAPRSQDGVTMARCVEVPEKDLTVDGDTQQALTIWRNSRPAGRDRRWRRVRHAGHPRALRTRLHGEGRASQRLSMDHAAAPRRPLRFHRRRPSQGCLEYLEGMRCTGTAGDQPDVVAALPDSLTWVPTAYAALVEDLLVGQRPLRQTPSSSRVSAHRPRSSRASVMRAHQATWVTRDA